jgi:hypothetical protein
MERHSFSWAHQNKVSAESENAYTEASAQELRSAQALFFFVLVLLPFLFEEMVPKIVGVFT